MLNIFGSIFISVFLSISAVNAGIANMRGKVNTPNKGNGEPLTILTGSMLHPGTLGHPYSVKLEASGGAEDYTWTLKSGQLPEGLWFSHSGLIDGTPADTVTGTILDIRLSDGIDTTSKLFYLTVFARAGDNATIEDSLAYRDDIVFYGGFEQGYNNSTWRNRWGVPWVNRGPANNVVDNHFLGKKSFRVSYPKGGVGPGETGGQFPMVFADMTGLQEGYFQEMYMRYYVKFEEGFDFKRGGKLPGLMGGGNSWSRSGGDQPDGSNGWTMRFMWRRNGDINVYAYLPPSDNGKWGGVQWGQDIDCNFRAEPGKWHCIEQYINVGTPGQDDGKLKVWIDGVKRLDIDDMRFWDIENNYGRVGGLYFSTFHGGNTSDWAPDVDSYAQFDGIVMAGKRIGPAKRETPELILDTIMLPVGYSGLLYNTELAAASGGVPPYRWYIEGNGLPGGLTMSREGKITGFPEYTVSRELTFKVRDQLSDYQLSQAMITISSGEDVNLANEHTIIDHSNNFDPASPVEGLWDGDISGEASGSPGAGDISSFWVEYDLGKPYRLSLIRFFGNASGDWVSKHYTVKTRKSVSDQWSTMIDRADCFTNQWLETRMDDSVRHIHLSVTGDTIVNATRARAFEVYAGDDFLEPLSIDSLKIIPADPDTGDTVKVISHTHFPYSICTLTSSSIDINDEIISVYAFHKMGDATAPCHSVDTLIIGRLDAGTYELHYHLSTDSLEAESWEDTGTITFTVDIASILQQIDTSDGKMIVYPNPASSSVNIDLTAYAPQRCDISIYSVPGQKIRTIKAVKDIATIDISDLPDGVYLISLTHGYATIGTAVFIKTTQ